jgi:exopolysaccharide production protein ExoZ
MVLSLQYLRAFAALMVVCHHIASHMQHFSGKADLYPGGAAGVDIFFVISGFIMWHTTVPGPGEPLRFVERRLLRIVPLYWLVTLIMFAMPSISGTIGGGTVQELHHLLASLAFLPWPYPADPNVYYPVYVPGWTINYEMFFYALFAICLAIQNITTRLIAITAIFLLLVGAGLFVTRTGVAGVYTSPQILEFLFGVLIGAGFSARLRITAPMAALAFVSGWIGLAVSAGGVGYADIIPRGISAALIVLGLVGWERERGVPKSNFLRSLGDASYAIYLTHLFAIGLVAVAWQKLSPVPLTSGWWLFGIIAFLASMGLGLITHYAAERPLIDAARPFIMGRLRLT